MELIKVLIPDWDHCIWQALIILQNVSLIGSGDHVLVLEPQSKVTTAQQWWELKSKDQQGKKIFLQTSYYEVYIEVHLSQHQANRKLTKNYRSDWGYACGPNLVTPSIFTELIDYFFDWVYTKFLIKISINWERNISIETITPGDFCACVKG